MKIFVCAVHHPPFFWEPKNQGPLGCSDMVAMLYYSAMCKGFVKMFDLGWIIGYYQLHAKIVSRNTIFSYNQAKTIQTIFTFK